MGGYGVDRKTRGRGRSVSGKVASLSSRDIGDVPYLSSRRDNSARKALRHKSLCPGYSRAMSVSGGSELLDMSNQLLLGHPREGGYT